MRLSNEDGKTKQAEECSARSRLIKKFFFTVQNNQLSNNAGICFRFARYLYSTQNNQIMIVILTT